MCYRQFTVLNPMISYIVRYVCFISNDNDHRKVLSFFAAVFFIYINFYIVLIIADSFSCHKCTLVNKILLYLSLGETTNTDYSK